MFQDKMWIKVPKWTLFITSSQVFVLITEIFWQTSWRNNWSSLINVVERLCYCLIFLFQSPQGLTKAAVITAVKAGYRFIDCANDYDNEHTIGEALKELYAEGVVKRFTYYLRLTIYYLAHQIHQPIPKLLHSGFLEHWNSQKSLCNIWQYFSCLLD